LLSSFLAREKKRGESEGQKTPITNASLLEAVAPISAHGKKLPQIKAPLYRISVWPIRYEISKI
jgi:hypothetical protein